MKNGSSNSARRRWIAASVVVLLLGLTLWVPLVRRGSEGADAATRNEPTTEFAVASETAASRGREDVAISSADPVAQVAIAKAPLVAAKGFVVVDSLSGEALEGADWQLDHASEPQQGLTAADGRIVLGSTGIEAMLLVHRAGYMWRWVEPLEHESLPLRDDGLRTLALTPTGQLDVRVVDEKGAPVISACIRVDPWRSAREGPPGIRRGWPHLVLDFLGQREPKGREMVRCLTNVQGTLSFGVFPVGEPLLVKIGWPEIEAQQVVTIDVTSRQARVEFVRKWNGSIVGRFVSVDGQPMAGVVYTCVGAGDFRIDRVASTRGEIHVVGLPAGSYSLLATGLRGPIRVEVASAAVDLGDVVVTASSKIEGTILFPDDGATVRGETQLEPVDLTALTVDAEPIRLQLYPDSHFEGLVPAGRFSYLLRYSGGDVLLAGDAVAPDTGLVLDVRERTCSLRLSIPAVEHAQLDLQLLPPSSQWQPNARPRSVQATSAVLGESSALRIRAVPEGAWSLRITGHGRGAAWIPDLRFTRGTTLDLGPVELGFAAVAGTVSNLDGEPLADVEVIAQSRLDRARSTSRTDEQGRYLLRALEPGPYELRLGGALAGTGRQVDLRAGETLEGTDLTMDQSGGIRGRLHEHGTPIVGARLRLDVDFTAARNKVTSTLSGSDGSFELDKLAPGERMLAIDRETPEGKVDFLGLVAVEVRQGEVTEIDLDVATDVELELWIGDERITDATSLGLFGPGRNERRFSPDPEGRFRVPACPEARVARVFAPRFNRPAIRTSFAEPGVLARLPGSAETRQRVTLPDAAVRVPLACVQPPLVRVHSVDGIPTLFLSAQPIPAAPVRWSTTEFELEHVPVGAELEVERIDAARGRVVERLRVHADGVARP